MKEQNKKKAIEHALAEYPRESCGLLVNINGKEQYLPCNNMATEPRDQFVMDPRDYADAEDLGEIIAIVHSHPDAPNKPSQADKVACEASGLPWHIITVHKDPATDKIDFVGDIRFEPSGFEAPLIGREFHHGVLDCYALVRDYYKREHGIDMENYKREDEWWNKGQNLYMDLWQEAGFVEVSEKDLQVGDMIVMQVRSPVPNHAGIYLGNGQFMHHLYNNLSRRDVYGGYWRECTSIILRKKELIDGNTAES